MRRVALESFCLLSNDQPVSLWSSRCSISRQNLPHFSPLLKKSSFPQTKKQSTTKYNTCFACLFSMHIKSVEIQGFKSYRSQSFPEHFSPKYNIIVGRNGSGKSNFFNAVHFVLSQKYARISAEERQKLLHEGTGRGVMTAFVEVVFDNSDGRFPNDNKEVSIRRTIGLKKDEYRIDGKTVPQKEFFSMLETAGISASNPYFIVEQGKVTSLTTMKESARLELLKEIAGTKVFDEKKGESLKIMEEAKDKQKTISDHIEKIRIKYKELETESKELKEFQVLDSKKRALEYTLFNRELNEAVEKLETIEENRQKLNSHTKSLYGEKASSAMQIKKISSDITEKTLDLTSLQKEKETLENERENLVRQKTRLALDYEEYTSQADSNAKTQSSTADKLKTIQSKIAVLNNKIEKELNPKIEQLRSRLQEFINENTRNENMLNELFAKQGRKTSFKSREERDAWIDSEVSSRQKIISAQQEQVKSSKQQFEGDNEKFKAVEKVIQRRVSEIENWEGILRQTSSELDTQKQQRDALTDQRKKIWKEEAEFEKETNKLKDKQFNFERELDSTMPRAIKQGIKEAQQIIREQNIEGVHGTMIELFECDEKYFRAVEVTAGNSLFHLVVDDDSVATRIVETFNSLQHPGRITFMPLSNITPSSKNTKSEAFGNEDVIPLISKLQFDPAHTKAFQIIFGSTFVCKNMEVGSAFSKQFDVNCVTLAGDVINRKGSMTGGFIDDNSTRMKHMKDIRDTREKIRQNQKSSKKLKAALQELETRMNLVMAEIHKMETEIHKTRDTINRERSDIRAMQNSQKAQAPLVLKLKNSIQALESSIQSGLSSIESLKQEKVAPLMDSLSEKENQQLETLMKRREELQKSISGLRAEKLQIETERTQLEEELNTNLVPREEKLRETNENNMEIEFEKDKESELRKTIEVLEANIKENETREKTLEKTIEETSESIKTLNSELEEIKTTKGNDVGQLENDSNTLEKLLNKRKIWLKKKEDFTRQIRELGSIPKENEKKYSEMTKKQLIDQLHTIATELKKFSNINKKAIDEFEQYHEQLTSLEKKKKKLEEEEVAIQDLIAVLDQRKDDAIQRTFRQVSKNFTDIFKEIVPGGDAHLVMETAKKPTSSSSSSENDEDEEMEDKSQSQSQTVISTKNFTGVAIRAKFPGAEGAMEQFSGGQKSVIALTLIFAIQRCDPAPFYLFDEIDSALDSVYRTQIAKMIRKQCDDSNIQFIISTFKTELLEEGDKFWGISFKNKVSKIRPIDKPKAIGVLAEEEIEFHDDEKDKDKADAEDEQ